MNNQYKKYVACERQKKRFSLFPTLVHCTVLSFCLSFSVFSLIESLLDVKARLHYPTATLAGRYVQLFDQHYWQIAFDCWIPTFCFVATCYVIYFIFLRHIQCTPILTQLSEQEVNDV